MSDGFQRTTEQVLHAGEPVVEPSVAIDRAVIELTPDAIYIHQDERVVFANPAMAQLLDCQSVSELLGSSLWEFIHPAWQERIRERIRQVKSAEKISVPMMEQQFVTRTGRVIDVEATACRVPYGERPAALVVIRDISERKRAQAELRRSEEKYRTMFEKAIQGMFQSVPSGRYISVNPAYAKMFGYDSPEQMLEEVTDIAKQIYCEPSERRSFLQRMEENAEVHGSELKLRRRDGTAIWVRENLRCVRDDAGSVLYFEGIVEEITREKAIQDALHQAEKRFAAAFHASPDGITISTFADGRYIDVNSAYCQLVGYEAWELIGKTSSELHMWTDASARQELIVQVQERGFIRAFPTDMRTKSGRIKHLEISADCVEIDGTPCLLAILRDVTDTKIMEQQLRQAQKMQAIGQLAGGIAHDFNNALMVIDSYADLARETTADPRALEGYLDQILKASHRAAQLTSQLLAFSRKQPALKEVVDIGHFLDHASDAWQRMLGEKIELSVSIPNSPCWCLVAAAQFESAILNLLLNARDAMPNGGAIEMNVGEVLIIESRNATTGCLTPRRYACVEIRDGGHGMAPEIIEHIFEPFFTTKAKGHGTGLGLASVYGIVAQFDGMIDVTSEVGVGTRFALYFPVADAPTVRELPSTARAAGDTQSTVLLVEDNDSLLMALTGWIKAKGFRVITASNGEDALRRAETEPFDILISDVVMPGISGNELYRALKTKLPAMRTILMSGYQEDEVVSEAGVQYLSKPFSFTQLSAALAKAEPVANQI